MNKYLKIGLTFLLIGLFSNYIAKMLAYFMLDKLNCYSVIELLCNGWDSFESAIVVKALSLLFYFIGSWGFVGTVLWYLEETYLNKWIQKILGVSSNVFGVLITMVTSFLIINVLGEYLYLFELFETMYKILN